MKVQFFFRNTQAGHSIYEVFRTIMESMQGRVEVKETFMPSSRAQMRDIVTNGCYARREARNGWIYHITGDVHYLLYFLKGRHTVVTVHDIMYYHYLKGVKKIIWKWIYINPLRYASCVTFISDFSKQQVMQEVNLQEKRISVIPNPVAPDFKFVSKAFNAHKPRILHIGTLERKNLHRTIWALQGIPCLLRIIGRLNDSDLALLQKSGVEYSNACDLTHEDMVIEYQKADIVNFPSLYEGFGMPIIEGQATGRIIVTSNLSPMKEVAGEGAVLVNPMSIESMRNAYLSILSNPELRDSVVQKGRKNILRYSLDRIREQYFRLYETVEQE